jgi:histidyl-tRNA synthetase
MGIERMLLLLEEVGAAVDTRPPDAYAILTSAAALPQVVPVLEQLRAAGVNVILHPGQGSMKSQFKKADASGAAWALIFGEDELARGEVGVKPLREAGEQLYLPLTGASEWASRLVQP